MIPGFQVAFYSEQFAAPPPPPDLEDTINRFDVFFDHVIDGGSTTFYNNPYNDGFSQDNIQTDFVVGVFSDVKAEYAPSFRNTEVQTADPFVTFNPYTEDGKSDILDGIEFERIDYNDFDVDFGEVVGEQAPAFRTTEVQSADPFVKFNPYTESTQSNILNSVDLNRVDYQNLTNSFDPNASP